MVRMKYRYILTQIITGTELHPKNKVKLFNSNIVDAITTSMKQLYGDHGLALIRRALTVKYLNAETMVVLIRTYRDIHVKVLQALALVTKIDARDAFFKTIHVAGTLRSCYKHLRSYAKQDLIHLRNASTDPTEKKLIQNKLDEHKKLNEKQKKKVPQTEIDVDSSDSD